MGWQHELAVEKVRRELESILNTRCLTNVAAGNRRPDLGCGTNPRTIVEVKTVKDLNTRHTREQLRDIRNTAERRNEPALVYIDETRCYSPLNGKGKGLIQRNNLPECGCEVNQPSFEDLVSCLIGKYKKSSGWPF